MALSRFFGCGCRNVAGVESANSVGQPTSGQRDPARVPMRIVWLVEVGCFIDPEDRREIDDLDAQRPRPIDQPLQKTRICERLARFLWKVFGIGASCLSSARR
jgi:hypothetical protein